MKQKPENKRYIVRKFVMAPSAALAIKAERRQEPDDIFVDEEWMSEHTKAEFGFHQNP